ncbi:MAG: Regulatory protein MsrR [Pelotomaculum sp. PtaU1.Bin035]|nr:MAG: Regulatory protein MsrR [Pelotomaculum sp. PtaU1.Bin035]
MRRARRKLKRKTPFIICCLLLLTLLAGCYMAAKSIISPFVPGADVNPFSPVNNERLNVLLLGIDARQGETMARTDTVILASVDQKTKQMALLSIPRDTRVNIPKYGMDKINSASVYGGPELTMKVVSDLLGINLKSYVLVNFSGFSKIVDALGGVTLDVEQNMYHWDDTDGGAYEINLKKGVQRLDGDKALQYVRYRDYAMGDIDRTQHQQKFLVALAKEMLQPGTIPKLTTLVPEINRYVKTNLSLSEMIKMASASKNLENGNIVAQTLPGRPVDINGGSYWGVDPAEARQMVARLFSGETTTNIVLTTPLNGQYAGSGGAKQAAQPEDDVIAPAAAQQNQQARQDGTKTQQGTQSQSQQSQNGTKTTNNKKPPDKQGQGTQSGSSGSGGTVIITPIDTGSGTAAQEMNTIKPGGETGTQTDIRSDTQSGAGTPAKTDAATGGASGNEGVNPVIPGVKVKT